jgi:curved DNA-binding protein CbpA
MNDERDAYSVLQVHPEALQEVVQAAYRALARQFHPDGRIPHPERMTQINRAYERVRTSERRKLYDSERGRPRAVGPGRKPDAQPYDPWTSAQASGASGRRSAPEVIDFGRYAGWRIADVARTDPDYLRWLSRHSTGIRYLESIERYLPGETSLGRRSSSAFAR